MGRQTRLNRICNAGDRQDKSKSKGIKASKLDSDSISKYTQCHSSCKKLKNPIVVSRFGRLYNKDEVIKHLLMKHDKSEPVDKNGLKIETLTDW